MTTTAWCPSTDIPGIVGDEAIVALYLLRRPRYAAQRGRALGYLLTRATTAPRYTAGGYIRDVAEELAPALALALSPENPGGPDIRHSSPEALRQHDTAMVEAVRTAVAAGPVHYCKPLIDHLRDIAVRPSIGPDDEVTWGARATITATLGELWLNSATPEVIAEVAETLRTDPGWAGIVAKAVLDSRDHISTEAAAVLRDAWMRMPDDPVWRTALVGAGLVRHLGDAGQSWATWLARRSGPWAPVALDAIARTSGTEATGDAALFALLDVAEDEKDSGVARNAMLRAVLVIDDRVVRQGRSGATGVALRRANEIAATPRFSQHERIHAALKRLA